MLFVAMLVCSIPVANALSAEPESTEDTVQPVSLAELAAAADVVVLAQARDTDYVYQRDFPVRGSAFLRVLIPYKVDQPLDLIEVFEEGLREGECYFDNPTVFEEGRRFLLFVKRDPEDEERYRGLEPGCALDVLVVDDFGYALRMPADGIPLKDDLAAHAELMSFADIYAQETDDSLSSEQRDDWLERGWIRPAEDGEGYVYTRGVDLAKVRSLLGPEGVTDDRHIKRLPD